MKKLLVIALGLSLFGSQLQAFALPACITDGNLLAQLKEIKLNDVKEAVSALPGATKSLIVKHPKVAAATLATAGYLAWVKYRYNKEKNRAWNPKANAYMRLVIPPVTAGITYGISKGVHKACDLLAINNEVGLSAVVGLFYLVVLNSEAPLG